MHHAMTLTTEKDRAFLAFWMVLEGLPRPERVVFGEIGLDAAEGAEAPLTCLDHDYASFAASLGPFPRGYRRVRQHRPRLRCQSSGG